jgi:hypothetical protein
MVTELSSVEKMRIAAAVKTELEKKYGSFPLAETRARRKQIELFKKKDTIIKKRPLMIQIAAWKDPNF